MKARIKKEIYGILEKMDDNELALYSKIYHVPRALETFEENEVRALVMKIFDIDVKKHVQPIQEMAREIAENRKVKEMKEDKARRKTQLKRNREWLNENKRRIQIKTRCGSQAYISGEKLVWECPGSFTDRREQIRKCDVILEMSMVQDEIPKRRFFVVTTDYTIETGGGIPKKPSVARLKGRGAIDAVVAQGGSESIVDDLKTKDLFEESVIFRCPKCFQFDEVKITLKKG